jgi:glutathione S-transferase
MIRLYDFELSGNCYKVRLLLKMLGVPFERVIVEFYPAREHKSPEFLKINPLGQLPVIDDDGFVLRDAQAILVYLAARYDRSGKWHPRTDAKLAGLIAMWLAFADALTATASAARLHDVFLYELDVVAARNAALALFRVMDEHLWFQEQQGYNWLCPQDHPTIADLACFPYVMLSDEGGISRMPFPALRRWCDRIKRLPSYFVMAGMFPAEPPEPLAVEVDHA